MQQEYKILCQLNYQGNADMYLVRDIKSGLLAVKRTVDKNLFKMYKEIQTITHPNLMKILDVWIEDECCVVIAEYISGATVADYLMKNSGFTEEAVCNYIIMLCSGVETLHNHGIIHRDISPNNVILTSDGGLKLCDYDISTLYKEGEQPEVMKGTYGFASPEQFGYAKVDAQSDIYSIGMLAYTMLGTDVGFKKCHMSRLKRAINIAVCMDKKDRYATVGQLRAELEMDSVTGGNKIRMIVQSVPGFRTGTTWKKIVAICAYPVLYVVNRMIMSGCIKNVWTYVMFILIPWILYMDLFHVSKRLLKLDGNQKWFRLVAAMIIQMVGYFFGGEVRWLI